jgi:hypothetical protein
MTLQDTIHLCMERLTCALAVLLPFSYLLEQLFRFKNKDFRPINCILHPNLFMLLYHVRQVPTQPHCVRFTGFA